MKVKKAKTIILLIVIVLIAAVVLVLWDPAGFLRLRGVERALGVYYVEEASTDEVGFSLESISFAEDGSVSILVKDGAAEQNISSDISVNDNVTRFGFTYAEKEYYVVCNRTSDSFKLIGTTPCDSLQSSLHERTEDAETIVCNFNAVR